MQNRHFYIYINLWFLFINRNIFSKFEEKNISKYRNVYFLFMGKNLRAFFSVYCKASTCKNSSYIWAKMNCQKSILLTYGKSTGQFFCVFFSQMQMGNFYTPVIYFMKKSRMHAIFSIFHFDKLSSTICQNEKKVDIFFVVVKMTNLDCMDNGQWTFIY